MNGKSGNTRIPLKGLAIGDGLSDPIHQMDYGDFLFQTGFVDENDRDTLQNMSQITKEYIKSQSWEKATDVSMPRKYYLIEMTNQKYIFFEDFNLYNLNIS